MLTNASKVKTDKELLVSYSIVKESDLGLYVFKNGRMLKPTLHRYPYDAALGFLPLNIAKRIYFELHRIKSR